MYLEYVEQEIVIYRSGLGRTVGFLVPEDGP